MLVSRDGVAATAWAVYSTTVGSPVGDTTGGTFRFTCSPTQAPCEVSVKAYGTTSGMQVHPRVVLHKSSYDGGPQYTCEYADGINNGPTPGALATLTTASQPLTLGIGGSADCGIAGPAGIVDSIVVPAGFYDVTSTFQFMKAS